MTDDDKKRVIKWLDKCLECEERMFYGDKCLEYPCMDFTTSADRAAVEEALVEKGEWNEFYVFAMTDYKKSTVFLWKNISESEIAEWAILSRAGTGEYRLCALVSEWLKKKEHLS